MASNGDGLWARLIHKQVRRLEVVCDMLHECGLSRACFPGYPEGPAFLLQPIREAGVVYLLKR